MAAAVPPDALAQAWSQGGYGDPAMWLQERTNTAADAAQALAVALALAMLLAFLLGVASAMAVLSGEPIDTSWRDYDEAQLRRLIGKLGHADDLDRAVKAAQMRITKEVRARVAKLAPVLDAARTEEITAEELAQRIRETLEYQVWADVTVITEVTRIQADAAAAVYRNAGVTSWVWLDSEDDRVCGTCGGNSAAGPVPFGQPFPSGDVAPPGHPRCRCAVAPA
jgi:SPP1 gp7 family putative phage head morphogenesis protein